MSDWEVNLNVAGRTASTGKRGLPEGVYAGKVKSAEPTQASTGRNQLKFTVEVTVGEFEGIERTTWISLPAEDDANLETVLNIWRTTLESLGHSPEELDAGDVAINEENIVNHDCFFYYKPGDKEQSIRPKFYFITETNYNERAGTEAEASVVETKAAPAVTVKSNGSTTNKVTPPKIGAGKAIDKKALTAALNS